MGEHDLKKSKKILDGYKSFSVRKTVGKYTFTMIVSVTSSIKPQYRLEGRHKGLVLIILVNFDTKGPY